MSDDSLPLNQTLIVGQSGSGKTTFALRYLKYCPNVACRFIFDDFGVSARKLGVSPCYTDNDLESALATRWVIFNPVRMFPGDTKGAAFKFFCEWVLQSCRRGEGKKLVLVDEIWRWCSPTFIPPALANLSQAGRMENIELVTATQRPNLVNESITGQTTELVVFRLAAPNAIRSAVNLSDGKLSPDTISALPLGQFIALNRNSGALLRSKVF